MMTDLTFVDMLIVNILMFNTSNETVAVCYSVLQCVAMCCSVLILNKLMFNTSNESRAALTIQEIQIKALVNSRSLLQRAL